MDIQSIQNIEAIKLIENATELFRLDKYKSRKYVENYIGLALQRSGFYGTIEVNETRALERHVTTFNTSLNVLIAIEGIVVLGREPINEGSGGLSYSGYGLLEVDGVVIYDGRGGTGSSGGDSGGGSGNGDMSKVIYDQNNNGIVDNSELVNGLTVLTAVPAGAVFTDTQLVPAQGLTLNGPDVELGGQFTSERLLESINSSAFKVNISDGSGTGINSLVNHTVGSYQVGVVNFDNSSRSDLFFSDTRSIFRRIDSTGDDRAEILFLDGNVSFGVSDTTSASLEHKLRVTPTKMYFRTDISGKGINYDQSSRDEASLGAWGTENNHIPSERRMIANLPTKAEVNANTSKVSFPEAPQDGNAYTRKDAAWAVAAATSDPLKINYTDNPSKTQTAGIRAFDDTATNTLWISIDGIDIP